MIRSKGVGVFFCTQVPKDVHKDVLAQLGNRIQHALRAFTPEDAKALKAAISTYPTSDFYDLEELLPSLGIGEAAVTILSESGVPTPVVAHEDARARFPHGSRRRRGCAPRRPRASGPTTGRGSTRRAPASSSPRASSSRPEPAQARRGAEADTADKEAAQRLREGRRSR